MKEYNYNFHAYLGAVFSLAVILVFGLFSVFQPARMAASAHALEAEAIERGIEVYDHDCATCHGQHGEGVRNSGPALNTKEFLSEATDEGIFNTIVDGRPGTSMPAWGQSRGGPYNAQVVEDLVIFIRAWEPTAPSVEEIVYQGDPVEGAVLFSSTCYACHGVSGEGTSVGLRLNEPALLSKYDDVYFRDVIANGRPERGMPTWGSVLSPMQIDDLTAYIRSWENEVPLTMADLGGSSSQGEAIFTSTCIACHGSNGSGTERAPRLAEASILDEPDLLYITISEGRLPAGMPNWGQVLSPAEINDVIAYLRTLRTGADSETGGEEQASDQPQVEIPFSYIRHCATCHGLAGEGREDRPPLIDNVYVQESDDQTILGLIANGRANTAMEGLGNELTDAEMQELVELLRRWQE